MSDLRPPDPEFLLARIDERLGELGNSRYWLAKNATAGKRLGLVTDIARKGYVPKEPTLRRIAELLGVSVDWLLGRTDSRLVVRSEVSLLSDVRMDWHGAPLEEPGIPIVGTGDCADLEAEDEQGHNVRIERSSFDPEYHVSYIVRPPALRGDRAAYAIYFHGNSMEPRFYAGEIGIAQPSRHAGPGDFVVVQLRGDDSEDVASVLVKRLVRLTARYVELEQFNPPLVFRLPRDQVVRIHRLVPPTELVR